MKKLVGIGFTTGLYYLIFLTLALESTLGVFGVVLGTTSLVVANLIFSFTAYDNYKFSFLSRIYHKKAEEITFHQLSHFVSSKFVPISKDTTNFS